MVTALVPGTHRSYMNETRRHRLPAVASLTGLCAIDEANLGAGNFDALDFFP